MAALADVPLVIFLVVPVPVVVSVVPFISVAFAVAF